MNKICIQNKGDKKIMNKKRPIKKIMMDNKHIEYFLNDKRTCEIIMSIQPATLQEIIDNNYELSYWYYNRLSEFDCANNSPERLYKCHISNQKKKNDA